MIVKNINLEQGLRNILLKLRECYREMYGNEDIEKYCNQLEEIEQFMYYNNEDRLTLDATEVIYDLIHDYTDKVINDSNVIIDINNLFDNTEDNELKSNLSEIIYTLVGIEYNTLNEYIILLKNAIDNIKDLIKEVK